MLSLASHTYGKLTKTMNTLLTGGHMSRSHRHGRANRTVKLALALFVSVIIAATFMAQGSGSTPASASPAASQPGRPLAELLNSDGTMNLSTGFSGTVDIAGWQMASGLDGAPRFVPAT